MGADTQADHLAILQLKHLYGHIVDGLTSGETRAADLARVFTLDARISYPPPTGERVGIEVIVPFFEAIGKARAWMWHSFSNPLVEIAGDHATGQWKVVAHHQNLGPDTHPHMALGRYAERYLRTLEGWRIHELVYTRIG